MFVLKLLFLTRKQPWFILMLFVQKRATYQISSVVLLKDVHLKRYLYINRSSESKENIDLVDAWKYEAIFGSTYENIKAFRPPK